ncbi:hypothetical protein ACFVJM_26500 [Streptomyces virginiae]|uniref:hypothetical protein n=1 Tax=Streptomyces virginiae TaxID=1961 RepID=UPI00362767E6
MAREVGLVPGTLVQRFGSQRGLLLALADRSAQVAGEAAVLLPHLPSRHPREPEER